MRKKIIPLLLLFPYSIFAQTSSVVVEGKVQDILLKPVQFVTIQNMATQEGFITDISGHYSFRATLPATLKVSLLGYKIIQKKIEPQLGKDTIKVDFILEIDNTQLTQVEVTATHEPELIKESGTLVDFEINQHKLWLLYDYGKNDHLELYDKELNYLNRLVLNHRSQAIYKTPHNILYLMHKDSIFLQGYEEKEKKFTSSSMPVEKFNSFVNPTLKGYRYPNYYYLNTAPDSGTINFSCFNNLTKESNVFYNYTNPVLSAQNDTIFSELGLSHSVLYPSDSDNVTAKQTEIVPSAMSGSADDVKRANISRIEILKAKMFLKSIFCEIRIVRDSIYIFNFDNDSVFVYTLKNTPMRKMSLSFDVRGLKYKNRDIIINEEGTECYFKFLLNGTAYLQKIDLNTGGKTNTEKLGFSFPEKIRIWEGYAYYTYSDAEFNGMFVRHFYRQKIN